MGARIQSVTVTAYSAAVTTLGVLVTATLVPVLPTIALISHAQWGVPILHTMTIPYAALPPAAAILAAIHHTIRNRKP